MPTFSQMLKSKTLWASLGAVVVGYGDFFAGSGESQSLILGVFGLISFVIRFYTDSSLTDK